MGESQNVKVLWKGEKYWQVPLFTLAKVLNNMNGWHSIDNAIGNIC